ncbi:ribonuclease H [Senna tora]|uniref:Ribonuclease H n=1 Tax=Senna tora TaxID=362788 RepID=A0A834WMG1_9FABA|nr:ribonuclease H [Senna tora]
MNFSKVEVEADSLSTINMIKYVVDDSHPLRQIISEIRSFATRDWDLVFKHAFREGNRVANALANWAQTLDYGIKFYVVPPSCCSSIIQDDLRGLCLPRGFVS